jgi:cytochrome c oxidase subunit 3
MKLNSYHPYHLVDYSPWPLLRSFSVIFLLSSLIYWFHNYSISILIIRLPLVLNCIYQWWRDTTRERTYQGLHSLKVLLNIKWGIILFILSEILFFFSFFWSFFHRSLSPTIELGLLWPSKGVIPFNAFQIPLLNTIILLTSGIAVTWRHHEIINNNLTQSKNSLIICILLGIYFTLLQAYEYIEARFSIRDRVYGSVFFITTGFHGLHVIIGTTFLIICLIRIILNNFSIAHHFGYEAAIWYWHFVDVVWLFLYIFLYWWRN